MEAAIGIDIGGTNTKIGIVDPQGKSFGEKSFKTQEGYPDFEGFVEALAGHVKKLRDGNPQLVIKGIGIGAPNGNFFKGTIEHAPNLKWKGVLNVCEMLAKKTGIGNVVLTNDANAAAIGEMVFGIARDMKDFVVITLGTGLGSGIVAGGHLLLGHDGNAGELGHVTVVENGRKCGCGKNGCLETYVSATGINRTVFELMAYEHAESLLRTFSYHELTSKDIADAADKGDELAKKAFQVTGSYLGKALANTIAHLSPQAIIIFGGLANAGPVLLDPVRESMEHNLMGIYKNKVDILVSGLNTGVNAAVLGASALVWRGM
jgi:glucokinase